MERKESTWEDVKRLKVTLSPKKRTLRNFNKYFATSSENEDTRPLFTLNKAMIAYFFDLRNKYQPHKDFEACEWYCEPNEHYQPKLVSYEKKAPRVPPAIEPNPVVQGLSFSELMKGEAPKAVEPRSPVISDASTVVLPPVEMRWGDMCDSDDEDFELFDVVGDVMALLEEQNCRRVQELEEKEKELKEQLKVIKKKIENLQRMKVKIEEQAAELRAMCI